MKSKERVRQARSGPRRQEIIQAALSCFVEHGYADTTMKDIRLRSKASNGSIYHHFKSKEQLAAAVYLEGILDYQAGLLAKLEQSTGAKKGITTVIKYHLTWVSENPDWARYLLHMGHTEPADIFKESINANNMVFFQRILAWLTPHMEGGTLKRLPMEICLPLLMAPCYEFGHLWLAGLTQTNIASAVKMLADAAWSALKAS